MTEKRIRGPYAVLMTPFSGDAPNEEEYIAQIRRVNDTGITGFVTNGSTAEYPFLSLEEQMHMTELCINTAAPGKHVIASACAPDAAGVIKLSRHAGAAGARAVLVCPPYYFKYTIEEREDFFNKVADNSPVPVILYSVPFFTQEIEMSLVYKLSGHENIWGVKDSSANMKRIMHLLQMTENSTFSVLTGTDDIMLSALFAGCPGSFTAFAAIFPEKVAKLYELFRTGEYAAAREIQREFMPLLREADSLSFPKGYKRLLARVTGMKFGDRDFVK